MLEDCKVVWLCPLEVELRAAIAMLDKVFEDIPPRARGQNVVYTIGEIGCHKVAVVGYYQENGLAASGSMAAEVLRDLPNLEIGLLVGIAGGIPSPDRDMQLGDVAVAVPEGDRPGVVGYDLNKIGDDDTSELKHWQSATHPLLRSVITVIRARDEFGFRRHLEKVKGRPGFQRPSSSPVSSDPSIVDSKQDQCPAAHPKVHYGTILSGNSVIKSKKLRDRLRNYDFADSAKIDAWQPYAAITAAAYAKEVLSYISFDDRGLPPGSGSSREMGVCGKRRGIRIPRARARLPGQTPFAEIRSRSLGLSGVGKSQLTSQFVKLQRSKHPQREIFWITGESQEAFEQSAVAMLKAPGNPTSAESSLPVKNSHEQRMGLVNSFFVELNRLEDSRWLLVIDGVSGRQYTNADHSTAFDIYSFVSRLKRGYILLTARRRDAVERYHINREIRGIKDEDAVKLLQLQVDNRLMKDGGVERLARLLKGLPLALRLAISVISRFRYTVAEYIEQWNNHGHHDKLLGNDETLFRSTELGFEELEDTHPTAARILTLFSFLDHRDLWYDLCLSGTEDTYPTGLRELALKKKPFRHYFPALADLSFIELKLWTDGHQLWETHPAIQLIARQRAATNEEEYVRCAISLVASQVPRRSYESNIWEKLRRLEPHAVQCWGHIRRGI
ncbi:hypothetical protein AJ79_06871 [Helicocarpus griseus UAMH5409]|uniref:Nucleoside phosphorylase domain-containing protein n=1 Tax=Helicocarpus griseus UAMH5409 TaxID=1447875 RepID=A0A2B7X8L9_9EURO|nr:hypothetical protein AJ79_06871 [Helicocarpus griseus UAMH5409]